VPFNSQVEGPGVSAQLESRAHELSSIAPVSQTTSSRQAGDADIQASNRDGVYPL